jgi:hypothetical protein
MGEQNLHLFSSISAKTHGRLAGKRIIKDFSALSR